MTKIIFAKQELKQDKKYIKLKNKNKNSFIFFPGFSATKYTHKSSTVKNEKFPDRKKKKKKKKKKEGAHFLASGPNKRHR